MKYFCALYMMPAEGLTEWMNKPEAEREEAETSLKTEWDAWLVENAVAVKSTIGLGRTKKVSAAGVEDTKNGLMLSSYVEAESLEAAAEIFKNHPHFKIPGASIEIMETNSMSGM